jgi:hypothetical protein
MFEKESFLRGYRLLKLPIVDESGGAQWPELFPLSKIDEMRNTVGHRHFSSQMMLDFIDEARARLDPGALKFYDGEFDARRALIGENPITGYAMYWDPSGGRHGADCSVCVLLYRDDKNRAAYIHDVLYLAVEDEDLHPLGTQCGRVLEFMAAHHLRVVAIEVNGIGNALPEIMREVAAKKGQGVIVQKIVNHARKETRILDAIEPLLTTGRLHAREKIKFTPLISEMMGWTPVGNTGNDDGLDALAGALRLTPVPLRPAGQALQPIRARTEFKV